MQVFIRGGSHGSGGYLTLNKALAQETIPASFENLYSMAVSDDITFGEALKKIMDVTFTDGYDADFFDAFIVKYYQSNPLELNYFN